MTMDQVTRMISRVLLRRTIKTGVDAGLKALGGGAARDPDDGVVEGQAEAAAAQPTRRARRQDRRMKRAARAARRSARMAREEGKGN